MASTAPEVVYEGRRTRVLRVREDGGAATIVKQVRNPWPTAHEIQRLRREHDLLARIDGHGAPRAVGFETTPALALRVEDVGGVSLDRGLASLRETPRRALEVALGLAEALAAVHARGVIHRDVNPSNAIRHPTTGEVWLIDFDFAAEAAALEALGAGREAQGTPPYMAPEQTGRLHRPVDARTDLYSLGVTLYELFGGRRPFEGRDLLEYTHAHLALAPATLTPSIAGLPAAVVPLVMTLLHKSPDDRYQSAEGVARDLAALLASLDAPGEAVALAHRELGRPAALGQDVAGREVELAALERAFGRAAAGGRALALVVGPPGIGKTSVVRELAMPVALAGGRLLAGKFDPFSRDVPLSALIQALDELAQEILAAPAEGLERQRDRIARAVGPNAPLLAELAPSWAPLFDGDGAALPEVAPAEAERRLQDTLRRAFGAIASAEHPLVLFLDDLQWADLASLRVLEALFRDPELAHVLLVLAWREAEVGPDHAIHPTVATLRDAGAEVTEITLGPLSPDDVVGLVARALRQPPEAVGEIGDALFEKTAGNPFFLRRLFDEAAAAGAFRDAEGPARALAVIRALPAAENVIELLRSELGRLDEGARALLSAAALLGESFDLGTLELAAGAPAATLSAGIHAAIAGRFLRPIDPEYWSGGVGIEGERFRFAFVHDRVQEAASARLDAPAQRAIHAAVARGLLAAPEALDAQIFRAAEHCTAALEVLTAKERAAAFDVLLRAGRRAFRGAAFAPAHRFLETAVAIAPGALWDDAPETARELWSMAARAAWLAGRRDLLEARVAELRTRARGVADRVGAEEILVQARVSATELHEALDGALEVLATAGVALPRHPTMEDVQGAIGATLGALAEEDFDAIAARACEDPEELAIRGLLVRITSAAYVAEGNLLPLIACRLVERTIARGASSTSSYGFAVLGLSLAAGWLLELAVAHGRHATALLERYPDPALGGTVRHVVNQYCRVWSEPLSVIHEDNLDVHRALADAGDLEFAGWVQHFRVVYGFFSGVPLGALAPESAGLVVAMRLSGAAAALACTAPMHQLLRALTGALEDPTRLDEPGYDEAASLAALEAASFHAAALCTAVAMLYARVLFGDVPGAAAAAARVEGLAHGAVGLYYQCPMRVVSAIALLDAAGAAGDDRDAVLARVAPYREALVACARTNPESGAHLLALFDAEVAAARGELAEATRLYDAAIDAAAAHGFVHDEGLANERAARFHAGRGAARIARAYLLDARVAWERWGATALVERFDRAHGELVVPVASPRGTLTTTTGSSTSSRRADELDLASLLKASQAIADEVDLDELLARSMHVLLENVGATRGVLLLASRGRLGVRAIGAAGAEVRVVPNAPFEDGLEVPPSVVRRVWRTGEREVYDDLATAPGARDDPYLARLDAAGAPPTSALCARFGHRGKALGVLYFENDLAAGAFAEDRLRVLQILAPQVAVAVRNTSLHEAQSRFVPSQYIRSLDRTDIVDVQLGDHKATEVTVFFSDIRGFTTAVERMTPSEALELINGYLAHAEPAITEHGGFVDSYLGDGIMALFDDPARNAADAVEAAVSMHHALDAFNAARADRGEAPMRTGVGLNTGHAILGTIGGPNAMKCGVVGDAVNLASRVEGLTKPYGVRLLVSDTTHARLGASPFRLRPAGKVRVKGRHQPLVVYDVIDAETPVMQESLSGILELYERSWAAYLAGDAATARTGFAGCLAKVPTDPLSARYLMMAMQLESNGVPRDWDGTEQM